MLTAADNACERVVVVGAINIDLLATAHSAVIADDSTPGVLLQSPGGVGRNVAENIARLGVNTSLVSSVGDDDFGRQMITHCTDAGIDTRLVNVNADFPTASYTAIHGRDGELLHAISDMRIFDEFSLVQNKRAEQAISGANVVVIDANLPESVITGMARHYTDQSIVADTVSCKKCKRLHAILPYLTLLQTNRAEAIELTGSANASDNELIQALLRLGPRQVLLTKGCEGAVLASAQGKVCALPVDDIQVISTAGAGDAVFGGVIAAKVYGCSDEEQLRWGMLAASQTLQVASACAEGLHVDLMKK